MPRVWTLSPTATLFLWYSSFSKMIAYCISNPLFSAKVLGITNKASAKAWMPSLALPSTVFAYSVKWTLQAISKDPAPGTTHLSSKTFFTALRPSRVAYFSIEIVCSLAPLINMVQLLPHLTPSMKVYFYSPSTTSYTLSAWPWINYNTYQIGFSQLFDRVNSITSTSQHNSLHISSFSSSESNYTFLGKLL